MSEGPFKYNDQQAAALASAVIASLEKKKSVVMGSKEMNRLVHQYMGPKVKAFRFPDLLHGRSAFRKNRVSRYIPKKKLLKYSGLPESRWQPYLDAVKLPKREVKLSLKNGLAVTSVVSPKANPKSEVPRDKPTGNDPVSRLQRVVADFIANVTGLINDVAADAQLGRKVRMMSKE